MALECIDTIIKAAIGQNFIHRRVCGAAFKVQTPFPPLQLWGGGWLTLKTVKTLAWMRGPSGLPDHYYSANVLWFLETYFPKFIIFCVYVCVGGGGKLPTPAAPPPTRSTTGLSHRNWKKELLFQRYNSMTRHFAKGTCCNSSCNSMCHLWEFWSTIQQNKCYLSKNRASLDRALANKPRWDSIFLFSWGSLRQENHKCKKYGKCPSRSSATCVLLFPVLHVALRGNVV